MRLLKKRGFAILLAVIIVLVLIYLLVSIASQQINWSYAENITYSESQSFKAIVIRDEQVINSKNTGECYYRYYNGSCRSRDRCNFSTHSLVMKKHLI